MSDGITFISYSLLLQSTTSDPLSTNDCFKLILSLSVIVVVVLILVLAIAFTVLGEVVDLLVVDFVVVIEVMVEATEVFAFEFKLSCLCFFSIERFVIDFSIFSIRSSS